jgi:iron complex transport system ATP-binding protein
MARGRDRDAGLSAHGLSVDRGRRRVVDDVTFAARAGALTALLGPNGAGKSTVLKAVAGLLPFAGSVEVDGQDVRALEPRARARRIAYVPQHSALEAPIPVVDVVAQGRFAHHESAFGAPGAADRDAVARALALTDLEGFARRTFDRLSYGERRRVLLARALATEARLLLLDEPTAALDVGHALALFRVLRRLLADGVAVLVVLHQLQEALAFADEALLLANGRLVAAGAPADVLTDEAARAVYGVELVPAGGLGFRLVDPPAGSPAPGSGRP